MQDAMKAYIPVDRVLALHRGVALPEHTYGAALFADISGFTPMTEAFARLMGPRRGADELTQQLNQVYDAIIAEVDRYGGSVLGFAGDAITCWFEGSPDAPQDAALRAVTSALAIQTAMRRFAAVPVGEQIVALSVKCAVAHGPARRMLVGDPDIQLIDALAGDTIVRMANGESVAERGDTVLSVETARLLGDAVRITEWRSDSVGVDFAIIDALARPAEPRPWVVPDEPLPDDVLRSWMLPPVYNRLTQQLGDFLTELRPGNALFVYFGGIDYENDPQASARLDAYVRFVQRTVDRYGGTLLQLTIGDKGSYLYASFGAPVAHEDDAQRAAYTAMALLDPPPELAFGRDVQIGIAQGVLRTGAYGGTTRRTYGVLGDDVNLSARLMQAAGPGEVLATQRVQQGAIKARWQALDPMKVKGKSEPIPVFRLLDAGQGVADINWQEPTYNLPMLGRREELARITEKMTLAASGQGQIIGLTGEAGMGKSRLLAEVLREAAARGATSAVGECQSYGTNIAYLVWQPIWKQFFGIQDDDGVDLAQVVGSINPDLVPRVPLLQAMLNLDYEENDFTRSLEPEARHNALEALLLDALRDRARVARAAGRLLVFVLEDIHWIDQASYDLLEALSRAIDDLPVMILLIYRPSSRQQAQAARVRDLPIFTEITLGELSEADARDFVRVKLDALGLQRLPQPLVERLLERAQGNPFYIDEIINYLNDQGVDSRQIDQIDLPDTLQSLVLSRIDLLTEQQKAILKVASIIGRLFRFAWLYGYYPSLGLPERVKQELETLNAMELTPMEHPEPELIYLFKHIVMQEVAYESLANATRQTLHEQFAAFLEAQNPDRFLDLLAFHYSRSANVEKRRLYLKRAGQAALERFGNVEATAYLSDAIALAPAQDLAERYTLHDLREQAYDRLGRRDDQLGDIDALATLAERLSDVHKQADVLLRRANYTGSIGDFAAKVDLAQQAAAFARDHKLTAVEAEAQVAWGQALLRLSRYDEAADRLQIALKGARSLPATEAHTMRWLGAVTIRRGDLENAEAYYEGALPIFRQIKDIMGESVVLKDLGNLRFFQGDWNGALAYYEQALLGFRKIGDRMRESDVLSNMGGAADVAGDIGSARRYCEQALAIKREVADLSGEGYVLINLGLFDALQGIYEPALAYYQQALIVTRKTGDRTAEALTLNNMGIVLHMLGDTAQAARRYAQSLALKQDIGDPIGESETRAYRAMLALDAGDTDRALEEAGQALALAQETDAAVEQGLALSHMGHVLLALGRHEEAADHFQRAYDLRQSMGQSTTAMESLAGLIGVALATHDLDAARRHAEAILAFFETESAEGMDSPARVYLACVNALRALGDARADAMLDAGQALIRERADRLTDPARRDTYLNGVAAHRALLSE